MNDLNLDFTLFVPEYLLVLLAVLVVAVDLFVPQVRKTALSYIAGFGLLAIAGVSLAWVRVESTFADLVWIDGYVAFFRVLFMGIAAIIVLASGRLVEERTRHPSEFYALIILATIGAIGMSAARELMTAYLSLELLSFSSYVLVSYWKYDSRSNEAGLKYFLLGAFASAILLYGLSLIYGVAGSTYYDDVREALSLPAGGFNWAVILGLVMVVAGLGFKIAAVPFHMWTPDAYEGAPLPITAFLSTTSKAAGFALLLRLLGSVFDVRHDDWANIIAGIAAATMILGNVVALQQHNVKRLMAYSSIGQVGYMLMAFPALNPDTAAALVLHLAGYMASSLVVFVVLIAWYTHTGKEEIDDLRGMRERAPLLAGALAGALFSLAGLPLFAGFVTKFILFQAVVNEGYLWLATIAVVTSVISLYYYLQVMRRAFVDQPAEDERAPLPVPYLSQAIIVGLMLAVFYVGLYPQQLFDAIEHATSFIFI